jgi:hypothetical protein
MRESGLTEDSLLEELWGWGFPVAGSLTMARFILRLLFGGSVEYPFTTSISAPWTSESLDFSFRRLLFSSVWFKWTSLLFLLLLLVLVLWSLLSGIPERGLPLSNWFAVVVWLADEVGLIRMLSEDPEPTLLEALRVVGILVGIEG